MTVYPTVREFGNQVDPITAALDTANDDSRKAADQRCLSVFDPAAAFILEMYGRDLTKQDRCRGTRSQHAVVCPSVAYETDKGSAGFISLWGIRKNFGKYRVLGGPEPEELETDIEQLGLTIDIPYVGKYMPFRLEPGKVEQAFGSQWIAGGLAVLNNVAIQLNTLMQTYEAAHQSR